MTIRFEMVAKLNLVKDSENFHCYEEQEFVSGWQSRTVRLNAIAGDNRFLLQARGGKWKDNDGGTLYLFDTDGKAFQIPFTDRKLSENIEKTANWRKRVIDLDYRDRRMTLRSMVEGESYDPAIAKKYGLSKESEEIELDELLKQSNNKRHEYLSDWDFVSDLYKLLQSDKIKDKKFFIQGEVEFQYSENKKTWYKTYVPHKIYLAHPEEDYRSKANVVLLFDSNALDEGGEDDFGKAFVNGYVTQYDNQTKSNKFVPYPIVILKPESDDAKENKYYQIRKNRFEIEEDDQVEVYQMGVVVDLIDGAQRKGLSVEELPEEVQEAILMGDISERDALSQYGGQTYGDRITESRFAGLMRGYATGKQETEYRSEDFLNKPKKANKQEGVELEEDDEDFGNLFDDVD